MNNPITSSNSLVYSEDQLQQAVELIYPLFQQCAVLTFTGSLGAGKTTLIQALLRRAGVEGPIQSPTFNYVNRYMTNAKLAVYHFDLYRLHTLEDFLQAGFDEYLYRPHSKALIEWPGIIDPLLQHDVCHITIDYEGLEMRRISYQVLVFNV